jgi:hypothetical protein
MVNQFTLRVEDITQYFTNCTLLQGDLMLHSFPLPELISMPRF